MRCKTVPQRSCSKSDGVGIRCHHPCAHIHSAQLMCEQPPHPRTTWQWKIGYELDVTQQEHAAQKGRLSIRDRDGNPQPRMLIQSLSFFSCHVSARELPVRGEPSPTFRSSTDNVCSGRCTCFPACGETPCERSAWNNVELFESADSGNSFHHLWWSVIADHVYLLRRQNLHSSSYNTATCVG